MIQSAKIVKVRHIGNVIKKATVVGGAAFVIDE
jgi:hypothetical protein